MSTKTAKTKDPLVVTGPDGKKKITLDLAMVKRASLSLRALQNPLRKKLLELITAKGKVKVTELYSALKLKQSVTSSQLGILRRANVVTVVRDGRKKLYSINGKRIAEIVALAKELAQEADY